jgi:hypothetical protein
LRKCCAILPSRLACSATEPNFQASWRAIGNWLSKSWGRRRQKRIYGESYWYGLSTLGRHRPSIPAPGQKWTIVSLRDKQSSIRLDDIDLLDFSPPLINERMGER